MTNPEPKPPIDRGSGTEVEYNGRMFYGFNASDRAELTYLRDWKAWIESRDTFKGFMMLVRLEGRQ